MTLTELGQDRRSALLECQRRILERIASGAPLAESLGTLARLVEEQAPQMHCTVLLADAEERSLSFIAAANLPQDFKEGVAPYLKIAPGMSVCGTAAYLREPIYAADVAIDPRWAHFKDAGNPDLHPLIAVAEGSHANYAHSWSGRRAPPSSICRRIRQSICRSHAVFRRGLQGGLGGVRKRAPPGLNLAISKKRTIASFAPPERKATSTSLALWRAEVDAQT